MALGDSEHLIRAVLRGEARAWPGNLEPALIAGFLEAGRYHGVLPLLDAAFRASAAFEAWPASIRMACREAVRAQAMHELAQRAEIPRVLDALWLVGVKPLLLKGPALAYSHYPNPTLRPRADTDLLIRGEQGDEASCVLRRLGYAKSEGIAGEFVSYQATWSRLDRFGVTHSVDLHWKVNNAQPLARLQSYDELAARAVPIPALGVDARAPRPVDALLFACIHRAGHLHAPYYVDGVARFGIDRLIWLYDINLLVSQMSAAELDEFARLAAMKRIRRICLDALRRTVECFATPVPPHIVEALDDAGTSEASARCLSGDRMGQLIAGLRALRGWRDRARWVKELAFPPARYMHWKYPANNNTWLPVLYARRGLAGMARLMSDRGAKSGRGPGA
jgi:hypothetical protein